MPRRSRLVFAPLVLILAAAIVTNLGASLDQSATAATVNVSASITAEKHLAATICTGGSTGETAGANGTLAFGALGVNTSTTRTCAVGFGSTNAGSVALRAHSASATLGFPVAYTTQGACSALSATTSKVGIDAEVSGAGTLGTGATVHCPTLNQYQSIPTTATNACTQTGSATNATCALTVSITTGTASAGGSGALTVNVA